MIKIKEDSLRHNVAQNGIEIYFDNKPDEDTLNRLKADGWGWNGRKGCWYHLRYQNGNDVTSDLIETANEVLSDNYDVFIDGKDVTNTTSAQTINTSDDTIKVTAKTPQNRGVPKTKKAVKNEDGFEIGDILISEWGYSMRLVDAYQVVDVKPHTIITKEIQTKVCEKDGSESFGVGYDGYCKPIKDAFVDDGKTYTSRTKPNDSYVLIDGNRAKKHIDGKTYYFNHLD